MKKYINLILILCMTVFFTGCSGDKEAHNSEEANYNKSSDAQAMESTEAMSPTEPDYWTFRGSDRTGYVFVPYNWTEEEYEYEFEGNYSLMLISPERNAMVSLIENNYGYDPKQYDSQEPAEYIAESYVAQYESQGGGHISTEKVEISGYTFYKVIDCYPAGSYADYDYYLYTYVAFTGDRFYTIVIEGEENAIGDVIIKVEESFAGSKK